jgi:hypothetical protein
MDNVPTADAYTSATTERFPRLLDMVSITVLDAVVYVQFAPATQADFRPDAYSFEMKERRLVPAHWVFTRDDWEGFKCAGVRVRSYVAGTVAHVTVF